MAAARAINDEQTEATVEVIHAYETLKETHNALVHQLQKLTVSMEELDWTLIEARKRKQVDACYPKQRRSDSATSNLRLEAKGSERASASKNMCYSQDCKLNSQQSKTRININARDLHCVTPVQERKEMLRSTSGEDSSRFRTINCARQSEAFDKLPIRPISRKNSTACPKSAVDSIVRQSRTTTPSLRRRPRRMQLINIQP